MKKNWRILVISVLIPLLVGSIAGLSTMGGMEQFQSLRKPSLAPPAWIFPVVWTILYLLMGISFYLIYTSECRGNRREREEINSQCAKKNQCTSLQKNNALQLYGYQLVVNFLWPVLFFNFGWYGFSYLWLILLWILVARMIWEFDKISQTAALLNLPYLFWLGIAGYLNLSVWILNR